MDCSVNSNICVNGVSEVSVFQEQKHRFNMFRKPQVIMAKVTNDFTF